MESVQNVQDLKDQAETNIKTVKAFTDLLHNISENNEFNQTVSSNLKNLNVENLNLKDYQSLYFDYIFGFINQNIDYLNSEACIKYFVDTFEDNDWGRLMSKNYPSVRLEQSTLKNLEKALININKAINEAHAEAKLFNQEIADAF